MDSGTAPINFYRRGPFETGGVRMSERKTATGEYLDPRAFGELLDLNRESVYRAIARGDLQAVRVGRSIRLPRAQLDTLLAANDEYADR
jgi:excisionase family DNA binding protein